MEINQIARSTSSNTSDQHNKQPDKIKISNIWIKKAGNRNLVHLLLVLLASLQVAILSTTSQLTASAQAAQAAAAADSNKSLDPHIPSKTSLAKELNTIIQQHSSSSLDGTNGKQLAEAIISRLLVDDGLIPNGEEELLASSSNGEGSSLMGESASAGESMDDSSFENQATESDASGIRYMRPEELRFRYLMSYLHNLGEDTGNGFKAYSQYPILPSGQAATMKRAAAKMGNYLQANNRYGLARNQFNFGLGKRPDTDSNNNAILRRGDTALGYTGQAQPVGQFGKRPSAHRFDFGLGKRVSPTYPRYDFGLGKRAPNRVRYDFGLGR